MGGDETPGVTRVVFTFVDRSRPTAPDRDNQPGDPPECRVLRTAVRWSTGISGPRPLILAVHGRDGDPSTLRPLFDAWVRAGYVVAAPFFLVTQKGEDDKPTGAAMRRQVADARFVLDQVLQLNTDPTSAIHGLVDPQRVGAAGMSLGGMTVYGLVSNTCCRDPRIGAAVLLAAVYRPFPGGKYVRPQPPTMLIQGDEDDGYHNSLTAYPNLAPPKWFITLKGSEHSPPFEIPRGPEADVVDDATTAFWNLSLVGSEGRGRRDRRAREGDPGRSVREAPTRTRGEVSRTAQQSPIPQSSPLKVRLATRRSSAVSRSGPDRSRPSWRRRVRSATVERTRLTRRRAGERMPLDDSRYISVKARSGSS